MQVAGDIRAHEQGIDPRRFIEAFIVKETQVRREFHLDMLAENATQEFRMPVQRFDRRANLRLGDRDAIESCPQRLNKHCGVAQIGRAAHFGDGDRDIMQRLVVDFLLAEDFDQGVAHQFAGAELALGRAEFGRRPAVSFIFKRVAFHPAHIGVSADFSIQKCSEYVMQEKTI